MKKLLLTFLLCMALPAVAEQTYFDVDGVKYWYFDGESAYIGGYMTWTGTEMITVPKEGNVCIVAANPDYAGTDLVIPETVPYNGTQIRVMGIADFAFQNNTSITSVSFPATFPQNNAHFTYRKDDGTSENPYLFGNGAFAGCTNLSKVTFSEGMKKFYAAGARTPVFQGCPIAEAVIPESLTEFDGFLKESAVRTIDIPAWVTQISFQDCAQLTETPALPGLTEVPQYCFSNCDALVNAVTPENATTIGRGAFNHCDNLETLVISNKTELIGMNAAENCYKLKTLTIGSGVKQMGVACFNGDKALEKIEFKCSTPPALYNYGAPTVTEATAQFFPEEIYKTAEVIVPKGSLEAYKKKAWFKFENARERTATGIDEIAVESKDAPAEYFDLRGIRVAADALTPGMYIKRQGSTATKIHIR